MRAFLSLIVLLALTSCAYFHQNKKSSIGEGYCTKSEAKVAIAYGGLCANGLCKKKEVKGDPQYMVEYKGRCYIFSTSKAKDNFMSAIDANIKKADAQWEQIGAERIR
jgi:YHS domain-containing protein